MVCGVVGMGMGVPVKCYTDQLIVAARIFLWRLQGGMAGGGDGEVGCPGVPWLRRPNGEKSSHQDIPWAIRQFDKMMLGGVIGWWWWVE